MDKKTVKLTEVILIPGKFQSSKVDGVWAGNLNIRPINKDGSCYCWMPKELGGICAKKITIELAEPKTLETLKCKKRRQQDTAKYVFAKAHGLIEDFSGNSQDDEIKLLDLIHLLGISDERILGGCAPVFEDLKVKLQELGARWYNYDVKDNKESFSLSASVERFIQDSRTESKMEKAGLTKEEIDDKEMVEAVMKKILDEQLEPDMQSYGKTEIDKEHRKTQQKYSKAKPGSKPKGRRPRRGITVVKAEKYSRKEDTPEEKEEIAISSLQLLESLKRKAEGGDKHE